MTNTQHQIKNLEDVAALDKALWRAYRRSLLSRLPPMMNPLRVFPTLEKLRKDRLLKWWQHYYVFMGGALLCGMIAPFNWHWLLFAYAILLFLAINYRSKFVEAYAYATIGRPGITKHSFGLQTPSLLVAGVMDSLRNENVKIDKVTLDSVIKLNKATQDFQEIAFGVSDVVRKGIIGAPYALVLWLFSTTVPVRNELEQMQHTLNDRPALLSLLIVVMSLAALVAYQLAFSVIVTKRDRKRYLLVLNMLRESYQEKRR